MNQTANQLIDKSTMNQIANQTNQTKSTMVIYPQNSIADNKKWLLEVPDVELSPMERQMWLSLAYFIQTNREWNEQVDETLSLMYFACKFAIKGRGRFQKYIREI